MYKCLLACLLAAALPAIAQEPVYNPAVDVKHYRFDLSFSDNDDVLTGKANVTVRFTRKTDELYLDLISLKPNGKGMVVSSVTQKGKALPFVHRNDSLLITLKAKKGNTKTVEIQYSGIPADGLIFSRNQFGKRTVFGDNWPNRGRNWLACKDHLSDKATVEFVVTAPAHYRVVANGLLQDETTTGDLKRTHWKETTPIPTKVMVIGCADFAVSEPVMVDNIPVTSWIFPEQQEKGFADYAPAADVLTWFIRNIGPYSYRKLANVQSKTIFGGMENAGAIFYSENSVTGKRKVTGLLAHEIAHQWFGDAATEKDWPHIWLSEGFATEMSRLYLMHLYGADTALAMLKKDRKEILSFTRKQKVPVVDTTKGKDIMQLLNTNSYQKGGWVLHMLRNQLGDSLFFKSVRTYYARYRNRNASSEDLQAVVEQVSGRSWSNFFHQWLYVPENPTLKIDWEYDKEKNETVVSVTQQTEHLFTIDLDIKLTDNNGSATTHTLAINSRTSVFRLKTPRPGKLETDPECRLLFGESK